MKGKRDFTRNEIEEIVALIRQRCSAAPDKQKRIRDKMRSIGFYGKDDFGVSNMTEEKFYNLIDTGKSLSRIVTRQRFRPFRPIGRQMPLQIITLKMD